MSTLFISDLHLSENLPCVTQKLMQLFKQLPSDLEALYILGDLFEAWVGDDAMTSFQAGIAEQLSKLSSCIPIYFMVGNRDFLIGNNFLEKSKMTLLPDPSVITLYGQRTLLLHGDSLCTQEKTYQLYRCIVRSKLFKGIFLNLPKSKRESIALKMRQNSKNKNAHKPMEIMDASMSKLKKLMAKHQCSQAVYGHTHRPSIYLDYLENDTLKIYVLSDWHQQGNQLLFTETNEPILSYF